jgi:hypothetical protein
MDLHESSSSLATSMLDVPEIDGLLTSGLIMQSVDGVFCCCSGFEVDCFPACRHLCRWCAAVGVTLVVGCRQLHLVAILCM